MVNKKISTLSGVLLVLTILGMILIPVFVALIAVVLWTGSGLIPLPEPALQSKPYFWISGVVSLIPLLALMYVLDRLRQLFSLYRDGLVLTEPSAVLILQSGKGLMWVAVLELVTKPIESLFSSWEGPGTGSEISIGVGMGEIGFLFVAGLLTLIGWAMSEAAQQAEENRSFV